MLRIQKLKRPSKLSGDKIEAGGRTKQKGVLIINQNSFSVWVDKFTPQHKPRKKK
jgi:hypothetical protein